MLAGASGPFHRQVIADYRANRSRRSCRPSPGGRDHRGGTRANLASGSTPPRSTPALTVGASPGALQRQHVDCRRAHRGARARGQRARLGEAMTSRPCADRRQRPGRLPGPPRRRRAGRGRLRGHPPLRARQRRARPGASASASSAAPMRGGRPGVKRDGRDSGDPARGMKLGINFDSTTFIEESVGRDRVRDLPGGAAHRAVCWLFLGSFSSTLNVVLAIRCRLLARWRHLLPRLHPQQPSPCWRWVSGRHRRRQRSWCSRTSTATPRGRRTGHRGARGDPRIAFAALAATSPSAAIFIPVVFMSGVIGKFFLQFGVTSAFCVLFSYLEAVTLAPARLSHARYVAREAQPGRPGGRPRPSAGSSGSTRGSCGRARPAGATLAGAPACSSSAILVFRAIRRMSLRRPLAPDDPRADAGSDLSETDRLMKRSEASLSCPASSASSAWWAAFGAAAAVQLGRAVRPFDSPAERERTQAEYMALIRKELTPTRPARGRPDCRSRGSPPSEASRSSSRCAAPTGQLIDDTQTVMAICGVGAGGRPRHPIPARPARAALNPDAPAPPTGRLDRRRRHALNALVGGVRSQATARRRRFDVRLRLLADQRSRRRTSRACACAPPSATSCRSPRWSPPRSGRRSRRSPADRERADHCLHNVAHGPRRQAPPR